MPEYTMFMFLFKMGSDLVNEVMQHDRIQSLMKSNEKFDVCIVESFATDALNVRLNIRNY